MNEDSIFVSEERVGPLENLFVVADGLGGHNGGEVASAMAVERFAEFLEESWREGREKGGPLDAMMGALSYANACVLKRAEDTPELYGMGTTFSACSLTGGKLFIVHIGDSRIYRVTKDAIVQITDDHSYVNEMVKAGRMTKEQAAVHPQKNIITKALGLDYDIEADGIVNEADADCVLLLCSDGLTDMLSDRDIFAMANNDAALDARAEAFVAEANRRGGVDNVSVVLVAVSKDRVKAGCQDEA
ncbi:MAG: Stp1/IreP family PP2C-type Ser/Thr phosphatase [Defluviitaleaceae bacterium]|nr:Stp1/IreP family PP2C-type Ser/Thr phosphatase [Defluviitaleaceae bacterium]